MRHTNLSRQTIHNYTMLGLIKPSERTDSGHRLYGEEVFDRIKRIEMLKRHHTLDEVRQMLLAEDEAKAKSEPMPPAAN